ncbi:gastrula zinc finger protein xFG20-1-like [Cottoperca gobio]|uniref:Gastrula zinc finger protein xFG20-1-like n=1 Tax=Cottoperca gobio TaxID=56716 RepID=A0A6J2PFA9_COTGO|nr:gastrula zinc finger protein xFG20-1-like [Cottoperca gobio]
MCKVQMLRALVKQRLTAAAEEIFVLFERTIAEYEEELCRSKEENERQRKLLDAVLKPQLESPADVQQLLLLVKEEVPPEQQEWSSSLDQEDPEPTLHIKEEQEELWSSQEGEQLQGLEEADITKFTFTPVPVKSEDDEEKPQSSQLHQRPTEHMETGADGEDCGGLEPARNSDPDRHLHPDTEDKTRDSSDTDEMTGDFSGAEIEVSCEDSDDCKEKAQSGLNSLLKDDGVPVGTDEKPFSYSECGKHFCNSGNLKRHMRCHTGENPFICSICNKGFFRKDHLNTHMRSHTGEKPFSCSVCKKSYTQSGNLQKHMRIHTGERPFSCSVCEKTFLRKEYLKTHMITHTGEKPYSCSVCDKSFARSGCLQVHMRIHTGEKPFSCSVCGKRFLHKTRLKSHMRIHTEEKPFSCRHSVKMCKVQMLRALVKQRLTAAAEEIFVLFERTIAEYEEELCRSKEENERQRKLLDAVLKPQLESPADMKQLLLVKEEVPPEQQEWSSSLDQQDPDPPPPIKEEQEELWSSQEGEQLQGLEEADITMFTFTPVHVKSEDDEEKHQSSQLHQRQTEHMETGADGEDCGGPEPARNSDPETHLQPDTEDKTGNSSGPDNNYHWEETKDPQSDLNSLGNEEVPVSDSRSSAGEKPFSCSECGRGFIHKRSMKRHILSHTGEKPYSCSECGKIFGRKSHLNRHMLTHGGEKPFSCPQCGKLFGRKTHLNRHMLIHIGEKRFSCSVSKNYVAQSSHLHKHMRTHTEEKPSNCSDGKDSGGPEPAVK